MDNDNKKKTLQDVQAEPWTNITSSPAFDAIKAKYKQYMDQKTMEAGMNAMTPEQKALFEARQKALQQMQQAPMMQEPTSQANDPDFQASVAAGAAQQAQRNAQLDPNNPDDAAYLREQLYQKNKRGY